MGLSSNKAFAETYQDARTQGAHHSHIWRTLLSGSLEVGVFRLKQGTNYLERDIEFQPLIPVALSESDLGDYLTREFPDLGVEIDNEGGVTLRLGPNQTLAPVASRVAFTYRRLLKEKREEIKNQDKHGDEKQRT